MAVNETPDPSRDYISIHVCGPRGRTRTVLHRCSACSRWANPEILCDYKLRGPKAGKTCDVVLCDDCAREVADNKHLCPPHAKLWDAHPKNPKNASPP